jgi:hypothetical protein
MSFGMMIVCLLDLNLSLIGNIWTKICITFIRPILEYGSEVWDTCGAVNSDRLEKVQTEAARIVTWLTSSQLNITPRCL